MVLSTIRRFDFAIGGQPACARLARASALAYGNLTNRFPGLAKRIRVVHLSAMITVTTCSNLAEAELLHSLLVENGIAAFVLDDAFGGAIRVQVDDEHAEAAGVILAEAQRALAVEDGEDGEVKETGEDTGSDRAR